MEHRNTLVCTYFRLFLLLWLQSVFPFCSVSSDLSSALQRTYHHNQGLYPSGECMSVWWVCECMVSVWACGECVSVWVCECMVSVWWVWWVCECVSVWWVCGWVGVDMGVLLLIWCAWAIVVLLCGIGCPNYHYFQLGDGGRFRYMYFSWICARTHAHTHTHTHKQNDDSTLQQLEYTHTVSVSQPYLYFFA